MIPQSQPRYRVHEGNQPASSGSSGTVGTWQNTTDPRGGYIGSCDLPAGTRWTFTGYVRVLLDGMFDGTLSLGLGFDTWGCTGHLITHVTPDVGAVSGQSGADRGRRASTLAFSMGPILLGYPIVNGSSSTQRFHVVVEGSVANPSTEDSACQIIWTCDVDDLTVTADDGGAVFTLLTAAAEP